MPNYDTRNVETNLAKIGKMIEEEDNAKDRSMLAVCHSLTMAISSILEKVETSNAEHKIELKNHQDKLDEHATIVLQGQTTLTNMKWFCSGLGGIVLLLTSYTYKTIDDMRLTLTNHSAIIPRIDAIVLELQQQRYAISRNDITNERQDDVVEEQGSDIKAQATKVESVNKRIHTLSNNKVNKAPKYLIK